MQPASRSNESHVAQRIVSTLIIITLVVLVSSLFIPRVTFCGFGGPVAQTLKNALQLYIAVFSMATDYGTTGDALLGWPGDLAERKIRPVTTVGSYIERLIEGGYLKRSDMPKLLQAPGVVPWDTSRPFNAERQCPFKIYRVKE